MATFVLVHGAWHGGWSWRRVAARLRAAGHEVYTPTMTGCGERVHLRSDTVDLSMHILDIVNLLEYEDVWAVTLVGHSYAGQVVTGVADLLPDRISSLVFLDAYVGLDGQSMLDQAGPRPELEGDRWVETERAFGVTDADDLAWLRDKMTPHPTRTMNQKLSLSMPVERRAFRRTYVLAAGEPMGVFPAIARRLAEDDRWRVTELPTGHDMMITMPDEVTEILLEASAG